MVGYSKPGRARSPPHWKGGDEMGSQEIAAILRESQAARAAAELAADQAQDLMMAGSVPYYVQQRALANYIGACALLAKELDRAERLARSKEKPAEAPKG